MAWKGSFKKLCLGLEVSETLKPIGISLLVNDPANLNELRVRSDAIINIIAPKIFFHGMLGSTPFFCHEFAHYGSCSSFLRNAVPFPILHRLMINFVDSLDDLHGLAIHRDLHVGNLVVFKTEFGFSIKINDLGTLMFKGSLESPAVMTTNSINLSPEIMKRCHSIAKAHQWDTIFDAGLSFLDWELMERFHAGIILLNIMLGKNPLRIVLEEKKPQLFIQASSFATSSEKVNFLRSYFLEVELDEIRNLYFSAFHCFYWTLLDKRVDLPYNKDNTLIVPIDFVGPTLLGYPGKITFKDPQDFENLDLHEAYTAIFDEYFDSTQLSCLDSYLAPKAFSRIEEIVDRCDERLKLTPIDYNDEYARILLNLDEPLESYKGSFLKGVHPTLIAQVSTRLDIIFPLLNLDPDARAPLRWVTDHLLALKDF